ncbi:MAG TPA: hypothetical protein DCO83_06845 [Mucilaginibacter sp.]|jgi:hypothetical protein|nr:hypothetical protein [Mucilaginibacter sp.]
MIKFTRLFITILLAVSAFGAMAQSAQTMATTSSPYSQYGLGNIDPALLPQNFGMGGIATAINRINGYNNINPLNPASYAAINFTTIDAGIYSNVSTFSQTASTGSNVSATNTDFRLSHVAFAIPVNRYSALSFGLLPYSEMGYNNVTTLSNFGTVQPPKGYPKIDTNAVNYINSGNGTLSKAYLGYGYAVTKHLFIGANLSYIFGNLQQFSSAEVSNLYGILNSRIEQNNSVNGLNYDYGIQYSFDFGESNQKHLVLGYSASANSKISTTNTYIVSQYTYTSGVENIAVDSLVKQQGAKRTIQLPQINHFGISYQYDTHFLIGADYTMGHWSSLTIAGTNAGFQDSKTINIGGQFTPDINSLHNYFARMDYRLGIIYDQTYLNVNNVNINTKAVTFGLGLPLAPNNTNTAFYKVNFSAEIGQTGTLQNGLVKDNFVSFRLGFTINDKWFQKYKFE